MRIFKAESLTLTPRMDTANHFFDILRRVWILRADIVNRRKQLHAVRRLEAFDQFCDAAQPPRALGHVRHEAIRFFEGLGKGVELRLAAAVTEAADEVTLHSFEHVVHGFSVRSVTMLYEPQGK